MYICIYIRYTDVYIYVYVIIWVDGIVGPTNKTGGGPSL